MKFTLLSRAAAAALASTGAGAPETEDDGEAGPEPKAAPKQAPPADQGEDTETEESQASGEVTNVVAASDVSALCADAQAKGFAEANQRMSTVFASDEGKANPSLAAFMLSKSSASAEDIIGELKGQTPAAAPAASAPARGSQIEDTNIDLGSGTDPNAIVDEGGKPSADNGWGAAIEGYASEHGMVVPGANANVTPGTTVNTPAVPPTGN